jgi:hypothetical protein
MLVDGNLLYWRYNPSLRNSELVIPTSTPQPVGPGATLSLVPTLWTLWHGWPYQELTLSRHKVNNLLCAHWGGQCRPMTEISVSLHFSCKVPHITSTRTMCVLLDVIMRGKEKQRSLRKDWTIDGWRGEREVWADAQTDIKLRLADERTQACKLQEYIDSSR